MPRRLTRPLLSLSVPLLVLVCAGCQQAQQVIDIITGNTAGRSARLALDDQSADNRRRGIVRLADRDFGRTETYLRLYRIMARDDEDPLVRATAIRSLHRARDAESTDLYVRALNDKSELVRLEAAKALAKMPDESAVEPLRQLVDNPQENRDVRIAATSALKHYRDLGVARSLAATLAGRDFSVAWQARQSLRRLTGQDFAYDEAAWLRYLTETDQPFA